jgi:hypothetical protein
MIGQRFGRLVCVQMESGRRASFTCDCGTTFTAFRSNVKRGKTRSCGCLARESTAERNRARFTVHGHAAQVSREYLTWTGMIQRCTNPKAANFADYGGRGIAVCEAWRNFAIFYSDMGPRPAGATLDRIDGAKGYEPGNCRWATAQVQATNRRNVRLVTIDGETASLTEWARRAGVSDAAMHFRIRRGVTGRDLLRPSHHGKAL